MIDIIRYGKLACSYDTWHLFDDDNEPQVSTACSVSARANCRAVFRAGLSRAGGFGGCLRGLLMDFRVWGFAGLQCWVCSCFSWQPSPTFLRQAPCRYHPDIPICLCCLRPGSLTAVPWCLGVIKRGPTSTGTRRKILYHIIRIS